MPPPDPEWQGGMPPPDDPEWQGGMPPPDDPEWQGGMPPPDDPEWQGGMPPPDDPAHWRYLARRSCGPYLRPPINVPPRTRREEFTGTVVVRLAEGLAGAGYDSLAELARERGLEALAELLTGYGLTERTRPLAYTPESRAEQEAAKGYPPEGRGPVTFDEIARLEEAAERSEYPPLHSLTSYWRLDLTRQPQLAESLVQRLDGVPGVDIAYRELAATDPQVHDADDTYAADQEYLDAAPQGIDARWAWTQATAPGQGVRVIDLEQGWFPGHEDLPGPSLFFGTNRDGVGTYKGNHGTAVLGEIAGVDNDRGVVGIAPGVDSVRMVSHYDGASGTSGNVAPAVVAAIGALGPGDLLLLEIQKGLKPTEIEDADFDAIRLATAHGIIVVEAAGNGNVNLDAYQSPAGDLVLNRGSGGFRESGAILVGAGESALPHDRSSFSNYGSRIDCYAWGDGVVTCGYGDLDAGGGDDDKTYTDTFGGTSSASPIVTGAALVLQGLHRASSGTPLSPGQMRALLSNPLTGTPQGPGRAGHIGVMPDLRAILTKTLCLVPDVYLRDRVGDDGTVPSSGSISASPDVIVRPGAVADPAAAFGEGSGTESSVALGSKAEAGQKNFVYVRLKNRGGAAAVGARATVYWSPVATLLTPDLWNEIGTTGPVTVPKGDLLAVAPGLEWSSVPATGHYCFVALADHPRDEAPPLPPSGPQFDWSAFRAFVRNHNNVTWRNFNVVDERPDPRLVLAFQLTGTPDRPRSFDFDIVQRLPEGVKVSLEAPAALRRALLRGRLWKPESLADGRLVVPLPAQPCLPICWVRLPKLEVERVDGVATVVRPLDARFVVEDPGRKLAHGHSLAIRQLCCGSEVGRVTWEFRPGG